MKKTLAAGWPAKDAWIWQLASGRDGQRPCGMASWVWAWAWAWTGMGMDGVDGDGEKRTKWIGPFVGAGWDRVGLLRTFLGGLCGLLGAFIRG